MSKDICWVFRVLAGTVFSETYHALKHTHFALQEETITEMLLLRLSRRLASSDFDFRAFTKAEEGTGTKKFPKPTGADFEFWFTDHLGNQLKLRVQAKRQFPSGRYEGLDPKTKQIQYLINHAGNALPIYLFYNIRDLYDYSSAPTYPSGRNFVAPSYWGCSFALASDVLMLGKQPGPSALLPGTMWPWHTLVCGLGAGQSLPLHALGALDNLRQRRPSDESVLRPPLDTSQLDEIAPKLLIQQDLPDWFDAEDSRDARVSSYLEEHDLGAVAILHQKEQSR